MTYLSEVYQRQYEESLQKARDALANGQDLSGMLRTIIDDIEVGRLWPARACLEVIANGSTITDQEKRKLSDALRQLIALTDAERTGRLNGSNVEASLSAEQAALTATLRAMRDHRSEKERAIAERYYHSIKLYHAGEFAEARTGFLDVLQDAYVPQPMKETARGYLERIEASLAERERPGGRQLP